jgi:hypothetical protein
MAMEPVLEALLVVLLLLLALGTHVWCAGAQAPAFLACGEGVSRRSWIRGDFGEDGRGDRSFLGWARLEPPVHPRQARLRALVFRVSIP